MYLLYKDNPEFIKEVRSLCFQRFTRFISEDRYIFTNGQMPKNEDENNNYKNHFVEEIKDKIG